MFIRNLVNSLAVNSEPKQEPIRAMDIIHSPHFNLQALEEMLMNASKMNDQELFEFVKVHYKNILDTVFEKPENIRYFLDLRFLQAITSVLSNVKIDLLTKINACKIVYDYMSLPNDQRDPMIYTAIQNMGKAVLKDTIMYLVSNGVPEYYALYMTCAMHSTKNAHINIQRLHYIIATSEQGTFTEQSIINIYIHMSRYHGLTMTDLLSSFMMLTEDKNIENEYINEMYSTISLAVLDMLNSMTSHDIKSVLTAYSNEFIMKYGGDRSIVRFSLRDGISGDYDRIKEIANHLTDSGYYVP